MRHYLHCRAVTDLDWEQLAKTAMHPLQVRVLDKAANQAHDLNLGARPDDASGGPRGPMPA